jgi:hypothetical protein
MSCEAVLGQTSDWKEVTLYSAIEEIVVATNASAFVGRALGTNKAWCSTVAKLPMAVAIPTVVISFTPVMLRPLLKPLLFLPVMLMRRRLVRMLKPILKTDMLEYEHSEDKKSLSGPQDQGKVPLTSWLLRRYPSGVNATKRLMDDYINVAFESTPSTAGTLFYILVELAADPDLANILREEIKQFAPDGRLPLTHLNELKKMDSVMRESARTNPFSYGEITYSLRI